MRELMRWFLAMLTVYLEVLMDPSVNDRAKVTGLVVVVAAVLLFGPKALIGVLIVMIVFALHDETLQSKIQHKLNKRN